MAEAFLAGFLGGFLGLLALFVIVILVAVGLNIVRNLRK